jgi:hypothetical protein
MGPPGRSSPRGHRQTEPYPLRASQRREQQSMGSWRCPGQLESRAAGHQFDSDLGPGKSSPGQCRPDLALFISMGAAAPHEAWKEMKRNFPPAGPARRAASPGCRADSRRTGALIPRDVARGPDPPPPICTTAKVFRNQAPSSARKPNENVPLALSRIIRSAPHKPARRPSAEMPLGTVAWRKEKGEEKRTRPNPVRHSICSGGSERERHALGSDREWLGEGKGWGRCGSGWR